jgi:D-beta-D-heptose 7-phosphate kinase/D-beta-D-heptose 1-phosphate adenosyltransferase
MIVWVNGCFDILHIGHIELFKWAKSQGDHLIVGIDSDKRV